MMVGQRDEALYVEERGAGAPLLLVPGLGGSAASWGAQIDRLAQRYRVILHDHRGTGRSARPVMTYSIEQMANDVLRVMGSYGLERVHVVGHSTGGAIGLPRGGHFTHATEAEAWSAAVTAFLAGLGAPRATLS